MDPLSNKFAALADPTRRAILARLVRGERSVTELAQPFAMSLPAVSKHLKVLEHAGLVTRGRAAQWRPCKIEPAALKEVDDWLEDYRRFWDASLDRLEQFVAQSQVGEISNVQPKARLGGARTPPKRTPRKRTAAPQRSR